MHHDRVYARLLHGRAERGRIIGIDGFGLERARVTAEYLECVATELASARRRLRNPA